MGATLYKDGSYTVDFCIENTTVTAAMVRLERIRNSSNIRFDAKYRL